MVSSNRSKFLISGIAYHTIYHRSAAGVVLYFQSLGRLLAFSKPFPPASNAIALLQLLIDSCEGVFDFEVVTAVRGPGCIKRRHNIHAYRKGVSYQEELLHTGLFVAMH